MPGRKATRLMNIKSSSRSYNDRTLKILWGRAAGRCAIPSCRVELIASSTEYDPMVIIGDIAHIEAASDGGPRSNPGTASKSRDQYDNLILLCKNCHARLDGQKLSNTVESIRQIKENHEAWVRACLPERGNSLWGWATIILQGKEPIDVNLALTALSPDFSKDAPFIIGVNSEKQSWESLYSILRDCMANAFNRDDSFDSRLAVFPLAPITACVALGYILTNRPRTRLFQYHRDEQSWIWQKNSDLSSKILVSGLPDSKVIEKCELAICYDISASITDECIMEISPSFKNKIHIGVENPNTGWLKEESQLKEFSRIARETFESIMTLYPNCAQWHLLCAVPAPIAVAIGQQMNSTMCPPAQLYEFNRSRKPAYQASLLLGLDAG